MAWMYPIQPCGSSTKPFSVKTEANTHLQLSVEGSRNEMTLGNESTNIVDNLQQDYESEGCSYKNSEFIKSEGELKNEQYDNVFVKDEADNSDDDNNQDNFVNCDNKNETSSLFEFKMEADLEVNYNPLEYLANNGLKENVEYYKKHNGTFGTLPHFESHLSKPNKKRKKEEIKHQVDLLGLNKYDPVEFICTFCDKKFKAVCDLKRHVVQHTGERAWQCEVCAKSFGRKDGLTRHMMTHSDSVEQVLYICNVCGKKLTSSRSRNIHELSHTGQFILHCEECSKGFNEKSALEKHKVKEHGGSYSHFCEKCGKGFLIQRALNAHKQRCGEIKPRKTQTKSHNPCSMCDKAFNRKCNLERHLKMHRGEKDYFCDQCGKEFTDYRSVSKHIKKKHETK